MWSIEENRQRYKKKVVSKVSEDTPKAVVDEPIEKDAEVLE